ncbi:uncharacterized protein LOC143552207 [Bidens hawaiensis]|uniref:uncharacterized protein LOC143552207 n=1 Tax=Bidens hawaiensis TaxID=980011 RepID=UPI00404A4DBF
MTPTLIQPPTYIPLPPYYQPTLYSKMNTNNNNNNNNNNIPVPEFQQSTPPKLSLFSLPSKPPPDGVTPLPNTVATIPFLWEEAPGKPKCTTTSTNNPPKSKIVRSLDLPPRLTTLSPNNNIIVPSPTTVLGGPYEGVHGSNVTLESCQKVVVGSSNVSKSSNYIKGKIRMPLRKLMRKEPVEFRSWRWDGESFKDIFDGRSPEIRFCSWRWDSGGKIGKVSRKNSFVLDNGSTSGFLANMYGTLKLAMPWKSQR